MMKLMNKAADNFAYHLHVLGVMLARALHELAPEKRSESNVQDANQRHGCRLPQKESLQIGNENEAVTIVSVR